MGSTQATSSKAKTTEQLCADLFCALLESNRRFDVEKKRVFDITSVRGNNYSEELWYNQKIDNTNEDLDIWVYTRRNYAHGLVSSRWVC